MKKEEEKMRRTFTDEERRNLIAKFDKLRKEGMTSEGALSQCGINKSSLSYWRKRYEMRKAKAINKKPQLVQIPVSQPTNETVSLVIMKGDSRIVEKIADSIARIMGDK